MTVLELTKVDTRPRYEEVVVPVDFSSLGWRVLPMARHVAHAFGAEVRVVHVDTASPWRDAGSFEKLTLTTAPYGKRVDVAVVAAADAASGIVGFAGRCRRPLVAISTHGHTGVGELAFGSVAEEVLRSTDGPVLVVGPSFDTDRHRGIRRIVACVTGQDDVATIVPEAFGWARTLDVPLQLLAVHPRSAGAELTPRQESAALLERVATELSADYPDVSALVLTGTRPGHEIVRYAASARGTLLAMATHARPPLTRAIVGSVVMYVARHTPTALLLRRCPPTATS